MLGILKRTARGGAAVADAPAAAGDTSSQEPPPPALPQEVVALFGGNAPEAVQARALQTFCSLAGIEVVATHRYLSDALTASSARGVPLLATTASAVSPEHLSRGDARGLELLEEESVRVLFLDEQDPPRPLAARPEPKPERPCLDVGELRTHGLRVPSPVLERVPAGLRRQAVHQWIAELASVAQERAKPALPFDSRLRVEVVVGADGKSRRLRVPPPELAASVVLELVSALATPEAREHRPGGWRGRLFDMTATYDPGPRRLSLWREEGAHELCRIECEWSAGLDAPPVYRVDLARAEERPR